MADQLCIGRARFQNSNPGSAGGPCESHYVTTCTIFMMRIAPVRFFIWRCWKVLPKARIEGEPMREKSSVVCGFRLAGDLHITTAERGGSWCPPFVRLLSIFKPRSHPNEGCRHFGSFDCSFHRQ